MNTKISYMYRDAANYKIFIEEIVTGEVPSEYVNDLEDQFDKNVDLEEFYPARLGLNADTFVDRGYAPYDDDPTCHELMCMEYTTEPATVKMTAADIVKALHQPCVFGSSNINKKG